MSAKPTDYVKLNISNFLDDFLARPASSIIKGAQWLIAFDDLGKQTGGKSQGIVEAIERAYKYEPNNGVKWNTLKAANTILTSSYQQTRGCLFCQAIELPGEGTDVVIEGNIKTNSFLRSYVGAGRNDYPIMRMTFLDTNVSFADSFLRGWSLATANFGMLARTDVTYRTGLTCYKLAIAPDGMYITQKMRFADVCCVGVSNEEYQYTPQTNLVLREARFVYNSYALDTVTGIDGSVFQRNPSLEKQLQNKK